jgi:hypothetical protein
VPYHVQVRRSLHRAWRFNLEADELRATVLEPWLLGRELTLGDRRWLPSRSDLRVLEGPHLDASELAYGQGWNSAERTAKDVTRELLAQGSAPAQRVAVVAAPEGAAAIAVALREWNLEPVALPAVRAALLAEGPQRAGVAAAVVHVGAGPIEAAGFDAGLVLGALGRRAVVLHGTPVDVAELRFRLEQAGLRPSPGPES